MNFLRKNNSDLQKGATFFSFTLITYIVTFGYIVLHLTLKRKLRHPRVLNYKIHAHSWKNVLKTKL